MKEVHNLRFNCMTLDDQQDFK
ncbi:MAG: hypothetical protein JWQ36_298, partial [Enterovirga sp.]|nr:hypothetical protein [Enterovirga sp.]